MEGPTIFTDELERKRDAKHFGLISWLYGFPITKKEGTVAVGQAVMGDPEHHFDGCNVSDIQVQMCFHCTFISKHPRSLMYNN